MKKLNFEYLWILVVFLIGSLISLRTFSLSSDIWYMMLSGEYVLKKLAVPHYEFFLYAGGSEPQIFGSWGWGVIAQIFYNLFGYVGVGLMSALFWGLTFTFASIAILKEERRLSIAIITTSIAILLVYSGLFQRSLMRAEVSLYLSWMIMYVFYGISKSTNKWSYLLIGSPLVIFVLSWIHTSALFALAFFILLCWKSIFFGAKKIAIMLAIVAGFILPILNPNGVRQVLVQPEAIVDLVNKSKRNIGAIELKDGQKIEVNNQEYLNVFDERVPEKMKITLAILTGCFMLYTALILKFKVKSEIPEWIASTLILLFSIFCVRGVGMCAMIMLIPIAKSMGMVLKNGNTSEKFKIKISLILIAGLLTVNIFSMWAEGYLGFSKKETVPGGEAINWFVENYRKPMKVFTYDLFGPYLAYRSDGKLKISSQIHFILKNDKQTLHYYETLMTKNTLNELNKYNVDAVILPPFDFFSKMPLSANFLISMSKYWDIKVISPQAIIAVRNSEGKTDEKRVDQVRIYLRSMIDLIKFNQKIKYEQSQGDLLTFFENQLIVLEQNKTIVWPD